MENIRRWTELCYKDTNNQRHKGEQYTGSRQQQVFKVNSLYKECRITGGTRGRLNRRYGCKTEKAELDVTRRHNSRGRLNWQSSCKTKNAELDDTRRQSLTKNAELDFPRRQSLRCMYAWLDS